MQVGRDVISLPAVGGRETLLSREVLVFTRPEAPTGRVLMLRPGNRLMEAEEPIEAVLGLLQGRLIERDAESAAGQQRPLYKLAETVKVAGTARRPRRNSITSLCYED